jgi:hypothetical protein
MVKEGIELMSQKEDFSNLNTGMTPRKGVLKIEAKELKMVSRSVLEQEYKNFSSDKNVNVQVLGQNSRLPVSGNKR